MWREYEGELQFPRNSFINDATHNTLQSDLYDSSKAEVLGRIQTTAIANFDSNWDWSKGHYLVIIWPNELAEHIKACLRYKKSKILTFRCPAMDLSMIGRRHVK